MKMLISILQFFEEKIFHIYNSCLISNQAIICTLNFSLFLSPELVYN